MRAQRKTVLFAVSRLGKDQQNRGMDKRRVIYYSDELNDEFSTFETTPPKIDGSYDYERKALSKKISRFFLYRIVMYPIVVFYGRVIFG